jgi:hypothetical protein
MCLVQFFWQLPFESRLYQMPFWYKCVFKKIYQNLHHYWFLYWWPYSYIIWFTIFLKKKPFHISTIFHDYQLRPSGIQVKRDHIVWILLLFQDKYIYNLLTKFNTENYNPVNTPLEVKVWYSRDQSANLTFEQTILMVIIPYSNVLGSLQYLVTCTQLDLVFFCKSFSSIHSEFCTHPLGLSQP